MDGILAQKCCGFPALTYGSSAQRQSQTNCTVVERSMRSLAACRFRLLLIRDQMCRAQAALPRILCYFCKGQPLQEEEHCFVSVRVNFIVYSHASLCQKKNGFFAVRTCCQSSSIYSLAVVLGQSVEDRRKYGIRVMYHSFP